MKKRYVTPEMVQTAFQVEDLITASGALADKVTISPAGDGAGLEVHSTKVSGTNWRYKKLNMS